MSLAWISNKFRKKPCPCQIHCHSFNPSLFLLCPFLLSYVDHCFKSMSFSKFSVPRPREKQNLSKSISVILFITVVKVIHQTLLPTQSVQVRQQVLTPSCKCVFVYPSLYKSYENNFKLMLSFWLNSLLLEGAQMSDQLGAVWSDSCWSWWFSTTGVWIST